MSKKIKVIQIKSAAGRVRKQKGSLIGLGLGKIGQVSVVDDTPAIRGMIRVVSHIILVKEVSNEA